MNLCVYIVMDILVIWSFPGGSVVKNPPANAGDTRDSGSIPGSGRSLGLGHGPLQYKSMNELTMSEGWTQAGLRRLWAV